MRLITASALILAWSHAAFGDEGTNPEVRLQQGLARGAIVDGGFAFKNLPYAAPPVKRNRWRPPQPPVAWRGVRDATRFGSSCPQAAHGWNDADAKRASEDCLSLNIWTPRVSAATAPGLPVMVWIHGGGFAGGSASNEFTDGAKLMRRGVVVVTLNYRVGVLGFLAHPDLARESPGGGSGNYGLKDQIAALRWVRDNIARFGGDPTNVTAFGQSAGGIAIAWLISAEDARGLFHRAIMESGNAFGAGAAVTYTRAQAEQAGRDFGSVEKLRRLPMATLIRRWEAFAGKAPTQRMAQTIVDGELIRTLPARNWLSGAGNDVSIIVGSNAQEFVDPRVDLTRPMLEEPFGDQADRAFAYYYPQGVPRPPDALLGNVKSQALTDASFRCSALLTADTARQAWVYQFDQPRPGDAVAAHTAEVLYVLGNEGEWRFTRPMNAAELALVGQMQSYWTNFARTGDPNGAGLPNWPRYTRAGQAYLEIAAAQTQASAHLRADICPLFIKHWADPASYEDLAK